MSETKILYAIQATGNGHLARAHAVIPLLQQHGDIDILVSGTEGDISLPKDPRFRLAGLSFVFGQDGGIDYRQTFFRTILPQARLRLVQELFSIPIHEYDWVLHDFEPITAWRARSAGVPTFQLSHQAAFRSPKTPRAIPGSTLTELVFRHAAPSNDYFGLHYQSYDKSIITPIIRQEVRALIPTLEKHYTVYLPSYGSDQICAVLSKIPGTEWQVFSKHQSHHSQQGNIQIHPIDNTHFLSTLAASTGLITGAGFQSTSEALFLGKKLLVIPQRGQFEQSCNAVALERLGVPTIGQFALKWVNKVENWISNSAPLKIRFPDHIEQTIAEIAARMESCKEHKRYCTGRS